MPGSGRTATLEPAAEIEYRRLTGEVPDFEEAYEDLMLVLCAKPGRGWPLSGGRWGYSLARPGKPRVRMRYTFNETGIRVRDVQATLARRRWPGTCLRPGPDPAIRQGAEIMKPIAIFLSIALALGAGACSSSNDSSMADEERKIRHVRNSAFTGEHLRVFLTLEDGTDLSVNSADDAIQTRPAVTPIPGHRANDWTFVKETGDGTSVAYALVSWDGDDPADYLMAGWWAQFHGQRYPDLSFEDSTQYAIVDGPEIDPSVPPELPPAGQATYAGPAGGLYTYIPGSDPGARVVDEYEGTITIEADFASATLRGCIGCVGDLVTRRAHFGVFLGDEVQDARAIAAGYELHLGETPLNPNGTFENADVTVRHPERTVTHSEGFWGGAVSNIADRAGNPRLVTGFSSAGFDEADGGSGTFLGTFVGLSEEFRTSGRR